MKALRHIYIFLLLASCTIEPSVTDVDEGRLVTVAFRTGTRSGEGHGDAEDRYINSLRVLGYRASDGTLAFNVPVYGITSAPETDNEYYEGFIDVLTGRFTIVFIANEHSDATAGALLTGITAGENNTLRYLEQHVSFSRDAFSPQKDIPMVTVKEDIVIQGDNKLIDNEIQPDPITGTWPVRLTRLGVRIDMEFTLAGGQTADDPQNLTVENIPPRVYLIPRDNRDGQNMSSSVYPAAVDGNTLTWERVILPESMFADKTDVDKGVVLSVTVNGTACRTVIGVDFDNETASERDYTLPRNTYLNLTATADPQSQALDCSAAVVPWGEAPQDVVFDGQYWLKVSGDELSFDAAGGTETITASTNYNATTQTQGFPDGLQVNGSEIVYNPSGVNGWITLSGLANGAPSGELTIQAANNGTAEGRSCKIFLKAGNLTKVINVTQSAD